MTLEDIFGSGGYKGNDQPDPSTDPLAVAFKTPPTMQETATDSWRYGNAPLGGRQSAVSSPFEPGSEDVAPGSEPVGPINEEDQSGGLAGFLSNIPNAITNFGRGLLRGAAQGTADAIASVPDYQQDPLGNIFGTLMSPLNIPLRAGVQALHNVGIVGDVPGALDVIAGGSMDPALRDAGVAEGTATRLTKEDLARNVVSPMEGDLALPSGERPALPAPKPQLALPAPREDTPIPMRGAIALPSGQGGTLLGRGEDVRVPQYETPEGVPANSQGLPSEPPQGVPEAPRPSPEDLAAREGQQNDILSQAIRDRQAAADQAAKGGLQGRGITDLTPVGRGDLTLGKSVVAGPAAEPPVDLAARTAPARPNLAAPPGGPLGESMVLRGGSRLEQAAARGDSWVTPEMLAKNEANKNLADAIRRGDAPAARSALSELEQRGASAKNTAREMRAAGLTQVPNRTLTFADLRNSLTGMRAPTTDATLVSDLEKSIKAAESKATPAKSGPQDILFRTEGSGRPDLIGTNEYPPAMIGSREMASDPVVQNTYLDAVDRAYKTGVNQAFDLGSAKIVVVEPRQARSMFPEQVMAETRPGMDGGKPVIYLRPDLPQEKFTATVVHELEHAGQLIGGMDPNTSLASMERRAYATHGEGINSMADQFVRDIQYPEGLQRTMADRRVTPMTVAELQQKIIEARRKAGLLRMDDVRPMTREDAARIRAERRAGGPQAARDAEAAASFERFKNETARPATPNIKSEDSGERAAALRAKGYMSGPASADEQAYYARTGTKPVQGEAPSSAAPKRAPEQPRGPLLAGTSPSGESRAALTSKDSGTLPNGQPVPPPTGERILRGAERVTGGLKTAEISASPLHFAGRHGAPFMLSHPVAWLQGVKGGVESAVRGAEAAQTRLETMQRNLIAGGYDPGRILSKPHFGIVGGEEQDAAGVIRRLGPLGDVINRSGMGFTMGLNEMKYNALKGTINTSKALPFVRDITAADKAALADTIRIFSGKGFALNPADATGFQKGLARVANITLFAPQFAAARARMIVETANGLKGIAADAARLRPLNPVDVERVRLGFGTVASTAAWVGLFKTAGLNVNTDWTSSNFLRADLGAPDTKNGAISAMASQLGFSSVTETNSDGSQHVMLDIGGPEASAIRALLQTFNNFNTGARNIDGSPKALAPMGNYALNQLGPGFYQIAKLLQGREVDFLSVFFPMWATEGYESAGGHLPTAMLGAAKPFKGEPSPDIVIGPTPAPTQRASGGSKATARPGATTKPAPTRKVTTR